MNMVFYLFVTNKAYFGVNYLIMILKALNEIYG